MPASQDKSSTEASGTPDGILPSPAPATSRKKFDKRWLFAVVALVAVSIVAIVVNLHSSDNSPTKITGLVTVDNGDQKINWDRYSITDTELSDSLTITDSGIYHLTGTLTDGMVTIDSGVKGEVKLILDNVSITNSSGPAISCVSGDDLVIELVGENVLEDGAAYSANLDEDINGVLYSKADLSFNGDGTLNIVSNYQDAIVGKDDIKFGGGTYNIAAADDGIRGKDSVYITGGTFNIVSTEDAIKSANDTDSDKGFILVEGGDIQISAGDDGMHAEHTFAMQGGNINITKSYEGIEAPKIIINSGDIIVMSSDDGINAGSSSSDASTQTNGPFVQDENCELTINGGNVYVNASGDGVDSNGHIYFNGGKVVVDGPTNNGNGALDSGIDITMNGGEVIAVGSSGMAESMGKNSKVPSLSIYFSSAQASGTKLEIKNSAGDTIMAHTSAKTFTNAVIGSDNFSVGSTYTIYLNGEKYQDFTIQNTITTIGNSNSNNNMAPPNRNRK